MAIYSRNIRDDEKGKTRYIHGLVCQHSHTFSKGVELIQHRLVQHDKTKLRFY